MGEHVSRRQENTSNRPVVDVETQRHIEEQKRRILRYKKNRMAFVAIAQQVCAGGATQESVHQFWEEHAETCMAYGLYSEKAVSRLLIQKRRPTAVYTEQVIALGYDLFAATDRLLEFQLPDVLLMQVLAGLANHPVSARLCLGPRFVPLLRSRPNGKTILSKLARVQFELMVVQYHSEPWAQKLLLAAAPYQHPNLLGRVTDKLRELGKGVFYQQISQIFVERYNAAVPVENARLKLSTTRREDLKKILRRNEDADETALFNSDLDAPVPYLQIDPTWVEDAQKSVGLSGDVHERHIEIARNIARQRAGAEDVTEQRVKQVVEMIKRTTDAVKEIPLFHGRNVIVLAADSSERDKTYANLNNDLRKLDQKIAELKVGIQAAAGNGRIVDAPMPLDLLDPEKIFFSDVFQAFVEGQIGSGSLQVFRGSRSMADAIDALIHTPPPITIVYSGHGFSKSTDYGITPEIMAYITMERERRWGMSKTDTAEAYYHHRPIELFFTCHGAMFLQNQHHHVRLLTGSNRAPVNEPMYWSVAEYGQVSHTSFDTKSLQVMIDALSERAVLLPDGVIRVGHLVEEDPKGDDNPTFSVPYFTLPTEDEDEILLQISKRIEEEGGQV